MRFATTADVFLKGFYPSFLENEVGEDLSRNRQFLHDLTDDAIISQTQDNFCFSNLQTQKIEVLNPFWGGLFDLDTKCDLELVGSGLNAYHVIRENNVLQPKHCQSRLGEVVQFARNGTLRPDLQPLCDKKPPEHTHVCHRRGGAVAGRIGEGVPHVGVCSDCVVEPQEDMFANPIFSMFANPDMFANPIFYSTLVYLY